jgi:hypothetical protein
MTSLLREVPRRTFVAALLCSTLKREGIIVERSGCELCSLHFCTFCRCNFMDSLLVRQYLGFGMLQCIEVSQS